MKRFSAMEDILSVLDGRPELVDEISAGDTPLRRYLAEQMARLMASEDFRQALPGQMQAAGTAAGRSATVLEKMDAIASLN